MQFFALTGEIEPSPALQSQNQFPQSSCEEHVVLVAPSGFEEPLLPLLDDEEEEEEEEDAPFVGFCEVEVPDDPLEPPPDELEDDPSDEHARRTAATAKREETRMII